MGPSALGIMRVMVSEKQFLEQQLQASFGEMPIPDADWLVPQNKPYERRDAAAVLGGKHWRHLDFPTVMGNRDLLPAFTPEGFVFYLPAFLSWALWSEDLDLAWDTLVWLYPPNASTRRWLSDRVALMSVVQHSVVWNCVSTLCALHGPDLPGEITEPLTTYWQSLLRGRRQERTDSTAGDRLL